MNSKEEELLLKCLKRVAPGTDLRLGIEYMLQAKTGGLLVLGDSEAVLKITNGGFYIGCNFTAAKLYELGKMDGAIILSSDTKRILYANTHLFPNPEIPSSETGTRHITAERSAKQTRELIISISQKRDAVTLYIDNIKYILEEPRIIQSKANLAIQTLEKFKNGLDHLLLNLTVRELEGIATLFDVASIFQRAIIVHKTAKEVNKYIYELGTDGRLLKMQIEELMDNVEEGYAKIIKDYVLADIKTEPSKLRDKILNIESDEIVELETISKILGYGSQENLVEFSVQPKGYRIISEVMRLPQGVITNIINRFGNLRNIMDANREDIAAVAGVGKIRAKSFAERLKKYSEYYFYNDIYNSKGGLDTKIVL
ncbi:MAG: DNA integrity scanning diadenylate cyclase DisA [Actinobacteria bacterium]|jgi:diadenylate cyclase|nr:DNA integrity scanning diadenylate cyclase DisA [Actinomycetota bacterium]